MLEHESFLLREDRAPGDKRRRAGPSWEVLDAETRQVLGFVSRRSSAPFWRRWLERVALEVHEHDDEPLLFTLYRRRLRARAWDLFDAEEHPVGKMTHNRIVDRFGLVLARAAFTSHDSGGTFQAPDGMELGNWAADGNGWRMSFSAALAANPFAKMLLLGSAVALAYSSSTPGRS
jgi:hypothetical protein